jgi:hypothetical protein
MDTYVNKMTKCVYVLRAYAAQAPTELISPLARRKLFFRVKIR